MEGCNRLDDSWGVIPPGSPTIATSLDDLEGGFSFVEKDGPLGNAVVRQPEVVVQITVDGRRIEHFPGRQECEPLIAEIMQERDLGKIVQLSERVAAYNQWYSPSSELNQAWNRAVRQVKERIDIPRQDALIRFIDNALNNKDGFKMLLGEHKKLEGIRQALEKLNEPELATTLAQIKVTQYAIWRAVPSELGAAQAHRL